MKIKDKVLVLAILLLSFQTASSQGLLSSDELEKLLDRAETQAKNYRKVFQNMSAEELKTKYYYDKKGELDEKRLIKSIFVVYQSPKRKYALEFRNVIEYNGKDVRRSDKEIERFFEKLAKIKIGQKEYNKIIKEGVRYDGSSISWGMTLTQTRPFSNRLKKDFKFRVIGKEEINGKDSWKIEYEQIKKSPYIFSNPTKAEKAQRRKEKKSGIEYSTNISDAFRPTNPLMKGTIWLDAETAQIHKNQFTINFYPSKLSKPVTAIEWLFEYQISDFGILVPKKYVVKSFRIKGKNDKTLRITKATESIYEYTNFKKFKTEIEKYEIN